MRRAAIVVAAAVSLAACGGDARDAARGQPYAGLEDREIAALSEQEVADLLAGRGLGYALTAELNHYPGPMHVLELADDLALTSDQREAVHEIQSEMHRRGRSIGRLLVSLERELDAAFENAEIDARLLANLTARIGETEARLREAHLVAHVRTRALLTPQQIREYDRLRGYAAGEHAHTGHGT